MRQYLKRFLAVAAISLLLSAPSAAMATSFTSILSFGDSLSDNGSADGFGIMRFSNGPVWVEDLAASLNIPLLDVAYGGATTGLDNPWAVANVSSLLEYTGLLSQIVPFSTSNSVSSSTLVTVWAGANDLFQGRDYQTAASNIEAAIKALIAGGADNFLVPNLPDIGATPQISALGTTAANDADQWCIAFNGALASDLQSLEQSYPGVNFYSLDAYSLYNEVSADMSQFGFTETVPNPKDPSGVPMFWTDGLHPSAQMHEVIAGYAAAAVVPEPGTGYLMIVGMMGLLIFRKRVRA